MKEMRELLEKMTAESTTVYIGNLSFGHPEYGSTTEEQVLDLAGRCGDVKRVAMGLDRNTKTPCGFCFVEFHARPAAEACVRYLNGTKLDGQAIRWCAAARYASSPRCCELQALLLHSPTMRTLIIVCWCCLLPALLAGASGPVYA